MKKLFALIIFSGLFMFSYSQTKTLASKELNALLESVKNDFSSYGFSDYYFNNYPCSMCEGGWIDFPLSKTNEVNWSYKRKLFKGYIYNAVTQKTDSKYIVTCKWKNKTSDGTQAATINLEYYLDKKNREWNLVIRLLILNSEMVAYANLDNERLEVLNKFLSTDNKEAAYEKYLRKDLLLDFFKGEWDNETNTCKWKNELATDVDNKYVYAKVDTIINFVSGQIQKKIIIINSYEKNSYQSGNKEPFYVMCHACAPSLSIIELKRNLNSKNWEIENSNKFGGKCGNWGAPANYELLNLWDNRFCILTKVRYSNRGNGEESIDFFLNCQPVLSTVSRDGSTEGQNEKPLYYSYKTIFSVDKIKKQLVTINRGTDYNSELDKIINVNKTTRYILNNSGQLMKLK